MAAPSDHNTPNYTLPQYFEENIGTQDFRELINSLPKERGWISPNLYNYKGFWFSAFHLQSALSFQQHFHAQDSDIILITQPKSGTIWLKALVFALITRNQFLVSSQETHPLPMTCPSSGRSYVPSKEDLCLKPWELNNKRSENFPPIECDSSSTSKGINVTSKKETHPLLTKNPHELIPFMEISYASENIPYFPLNNERRLLSTHLPHASLPKLVQESSECKLIYLCRSPKDTFVSYWHFANKIIRDHDNHGLKRMSLCEALDSYCKGVSFSGPFWDHVLGYWKESLENPRKVLFLKYEEIKEDPDVQLRRIAAFLGCPFSEEEDECGVVDEILKLCSFDSLRNLEVNKSGKGMFGNENNVMFRKGEVGDWRNHLTDEMANRIDQIVEEKFSGIGLKL